MGFKIFETTANKQYKDADPNWQHSREDHDLPEEVKQALKLLCEEIEKAPTLEYKLFQILKTKLDLAAFKLQWQASSAPTGFEDIRITVNVIYKAVSYKVCEFIVNNHEERDTIDSLNTEDDHLRTKLFF